MAASPSHAFGQHLGNLLERLLSPELEKFSAVKGLFLDRHGVRKGVRKGPKLTWYDMYGNAHDLDFVLERGGTANVQGRPVAFVEAAWRSYAKHSKNKVQEIQSAVLPLAAKYKWDNPFLGAVLAGTFTAPSLAQLRSVGFQVLHFPAGDVQSAFRACGISIDYTQETDDHWFSHKLDQILAAGPTFEKAVIERLTNAFREKIDDFLSKLESRITVAVERVVVVPLYGTGQQFPSLTTAVDYLESGIFASATAELFGFDVTVNYINGDRLNGVFGSAAQALSFLKHVRSD